MKKSARLLALFLILCMAVSIFASCDDKNNAQTNDTNGTTDGTTPDDKVPDDKTPDDGQTQQPPADTVEYLSYAELCAELASSIYKTGRNIGNDKKFGLSDPSSVGIDKNRFENEVLYPVPADSEFAAIFDVTEYGVSTENENNSAAINAIIEQAKAIDGLKKIYFPKGVYKVGDTMTFTGAKDIYFCGDEAEFLGTRWFSMFTITTSQNIHFNGLRVDFNPSPVITGEAISYSKLENSVVLKIGDEFNFPSYADKVTYIHSYLEHEYDDLTGKYYPTGYGNVLLGSEFGGFTYDKEKNEITIKFRSGAKEVAVGTKVSLAVAGKEGTCFTGRQSDYLYWEDVTVYSNPGMVFLYYNGSNIFFNNANIMLREGSSRMMTATSDSMHFVDVAGQVKVTNCTIQCSLDDCMNIKTRYRTIKSIDGKTIVSDTAAYSTQSFYHVGDVVEMFDPRDLSSRGYFTVTDLTYENYTWTLTFDKEIPAEYINSVFANDTTSTELIVDNNIFGNKRNRAFLVQCRDVTITNNVFANIIHGGVIIHSVRDQYGEGMVPKNVTVKNNKFFNNFEGDLCVNSWGTQKSSPGVITGVVIENNFFANSTRCPVNVNTAGGGIIQNNMFYNICRGVEKLGLAPDASTAISINVSEEMTVIGNLLYTDTENKRLKMINITKESMFKETKLNVYKYGE